MRPVIGSGPKEPHHHYCAIGLTRDCLTYTATSPPRIHGPPPRWGGEDIQGDSTVVGQIQISRGGQAYDKHPKSQWNMGAQTPSGGSR
ncbi:hypothetical protein AVEN_166866-1 [Araneus ventricosus]|uniref:Uncharacterized protein n=1 Tax=Araneus ventricosus TaxID=182803 RepID=A0A4Y2KZK0_ARAVE|nr:hypothetical protein AVEN_166866-1 [Araneus ventricosus]